ncbi:hypothetical protein BD779DRAFT_1519173 [Infundibulicybe gibba]|nr:hypothetical protein BD779DRAFT_1519173 [Infundibulicybe gibba]
MILLYRCWIIWDRRRTVVAAPGFLALVSLEKIIHLTELTAAITYSTSLAVNALTTSLIMAKILATSWEACPASGSGSHRSYHIVTAMLIESGFLTFAFQLAFVILFSFRPPALEIVASTITQIYGITPTLLNIRVVTGSAYDKTTGETRYLRLAHSGGATAQTTSPSMSVARVQSWDADFKPDEYVGDLNDLREENQRLKEENDRLRLRKPY